MSRVMSLRDLQRFEALRTYKETSLIHPVMDLVMFKYLGALGFSLDHPIEYIPSFHRDMQGRVALGFQAVGEIDHENKEYLRSHLCPLVDRLMAAAKKDMSLCVELCQMSGQRVPLDDDAIEEDNSFQDEWIEPNYKTNLASIEALLEIRDNIRRPRRNENGTEKTPKEIIYEFEKGSSN